MTSLPGYDVWRSASPPEAPACQNCGHDYGEHSGSLDGWDPDDCQVEGCACEMYDDEPPEPDPDAKWDSRYD